jgi:putative transcriptional regulator
MSNFKSIRDLLGVTQVALASGMGCSQGNVSFYEKGQTIPPDAAKRLIDFAATLGHTITFNDVYGSDSTFDADPIDANLDTAMAETAKDGQIDRRTVVRRAHDHAIRDALKGKGV